VLLLAGISGQKGVGDFEYAAVLALTAPALIFGHRPGTLRDSCRLARALMDQADQDGDDDDNEGNADD
jgi:hypothetical protein